MAGLMGAGLAQQILNWASLVKPMRVSLRQERVDRIRGAQKQRNKQKNKQTKKQHDEQGLLLQLLSIFIFFLFGFLPLVDNFANLGGLWTGFTTGLMFIPKMKSSKTRLMKYRVCNIVLRVFGVLATIVYFVAVFAWFFAAPNFRCSYCYYLTPSWTSILSKLLGLFGIQLPPQLQFK